MSPRESVAQSDVATGGPFVSTHWSAVLAAGDSSAPTAREALELLCRSYWPPLYLYVRRRGASPEEAEDLIQGFFAHMLEKGVIRRAEEGRGRFRSYLLGALKRYSADERSKANAMKRGGGMVPLSLDFVSGEGSYQQYLSQNLTPEMIYERVWAETLVAQARARLAEIYEQRGQKRLFDSLKGALSGDDVAPHETIAEELSMTKGAVQVALHRMRRRLADAIREEIAQTVSSPDEVEDEIRGLFSAFE